MPKWFLRAQRIEKLSYLFPHMQDSFTTHTSVILIRPLISHTCWKNIYHILDEIGKSWNELIYCHNAELKIYAAYVLHHIFLCF